MNNPIYSRCQIEFEVGKCFIESGIFNNIDQTKYPASSLKCQHYRFFIYISSLIKDKLKIVLTFQFDSRYHLALDSLVTDKMRKLTYCPLPKAGTTTWLNQFLRMTDIKRIARQAKRKNVTQDTMPHSFVTEKMKVLNAWALEREKSRHVKNLIY